MISQNDLQKHFIQTMNQLYHVQDGSKIAVAVSGGADSLCMTFLAQEWAKTRQINLYAITVDHGLRPESRSEASQVGGWLHQRGMMHITIRCDSFDKRPVSQNAARHMRYKVLASWCQHHAIRTLILGHQADDQLETFLMRLDHASGPYGLACIAPRSTLHGLTLLRPLLKVRHSVLVQTLIAQAQPWIEDPSNTHNQFARTRYRSMVRTLEDAGLNLNRVLSSIQKLRGHETEWRDAAEHLIQYAVHSLSQHSVQSWHIQRTLWNQAPWPIQKKALAMLLQRIHPRPYAPKNSDQKIMRILNAFHDIHHKTRLTLGGCLFEFTPQTIDVCPENLRKGGSYVYKDHETYSEVPEVLMGVEDLDLNDNRNNPFGVENEDA